MEVLVYEYKTGALLRIVLFNKLFIVSFEFNTISQPWYTTRNAKNTDGAEYISGFLILFLVRQMELLEEKKVTFFSLFVK